jgi:hypothetical protein
MRTALASKVLPPSLKLRVGALQQINMTLSKASNRVPHAVSAQRHTTAQILLCTLFAGIYRECTNRVKILINILLSVHSFEISGRVSAPDGRGVD